MALKGLEYFAVTAMAAQLHGYLKGHKAARDAFETHYARFIAAVESDSLLAMPAALIKQIVADIRD
jgi:hypothetical protein